MDNAPSYRVLLRWKVCRLIWLTSASPSLIKRARIEYIRDGTYHIINTSTGAYAALLTEHDRGEVVNITFGLTDDVNRGSEVSVSPVLSDCQWH